VGLFTIAGMTIFYVRDVLGDATFAPVALALSFGPILVIGWFLPRLVARLGKKRLYAVAALVGAAGALLLLVAPAGSTVVVFVGFLLLGATSGVCNTMMWNLEADTIEYGELHTGIRTEGTTYAVFSFMRKLGQALGGAAGVWIIGLFGYVGGIEQQSESAVWGIRVAVGALPCAMFVISALLIRAFPFDERSHTEALRTIRERRTGVLPTTLHPLDEDTEL